MTVRIVSTLETPSSALRDHLVTLGFREVGCPRKGMVAIQYSEEARPVLDGAIRDFMHDAIARGADVDIAAALHALGSVPTVVAMQRVKQQARERARR